MTISTSWPAWSIERDPTDLGRYVVPDEVARLARIPGRSGESALTRLNTAWDELRSWKVGYVHDPEGSGEAGQLIRTPGEVLGTPRNATCLDIALVLAGACEHAGLACAVLVVDPKGAGRPRHALVAVLLGQVWPADWQDTALWPHGQDGLAAQVRVDVQLPGLDVVVLDPVGLTHSLGMSTIVGTDQSLGLAAAAGHRYLTSGEWACRLGVVAAGNTDVFVPARVPKVLPLREIYRDPETAESALRLLRAEYAVTPFAARDELTILTDLCEKVEAGHRTGMVVVHGAGGSGKTRLALELADRLRKEGWYTGPLKEKLAAADPTSLPWLAQVAAPLLVFVDYADARVGETQALLRVLQDRPGPPAVVLLTARSLDGDWLERITADQTALAHPVVVEPLGLPDTHPHTEDVFRSTFIAVRKRELRLALATEAPPLPAVGQTARWTTLDLVLLGWLAAKGTTDLPTTTSELYDEALTHEASYWARTFTDITGEPRPNQEVLSQAGAVLTLLQPLVAEADRALRALPKLSNEGKWRDQVSRTMATCMGPGAGERLSIRPDPVGDHHLLGVLHDQPDLLHGCLPVGTDKEALLGPLVVLNRAGQDDAEAAARYLADLVRAEPARWPEVLAVASALGGPAQAALEALVAADKCPLPLDDLSRHLPHDATGLWRLAMLVDDRRLRSADPFDASGRAALLQEVSSRHGNAGDRAGALSAVEEAVAFYRELAGANPAFTPDLATSLNNLSNRRSAVGDRAGALGAIEEAVALRRELAGADPAVFTPDLAGSLSNLSNWRSAVGDRAGALAAGEEAAAFYRELAGVDAAAFTPDLAMSLSNLSVRRSEAGDWAGALAAGEEATAFYRELAEANAAAFTPNFAASLNNLSIWRSTVGDRAGALGAIEEAVVLRAELAGANPAAFTPDLAASLKNLSSRRSAVGDRAGALAAGEEATAFYRELAGADPAAFTPDLAGSLNTLSNRRSETGDRAGALSAIEEATAFYRELAAASPAAFISSLAASLNNLSDRRSAAGDRAGALGAIEEAVALRRELAGADPAAFIPDLAASLNDLSILRSAVGDRASALGAIEEAVALRRELAGADPAAFTPDLAASLNNLSIPRSEVGDRAGALSAIEEAIALYRELAGADPVAFTPDPSGLVE